MARNYERFGANEPFKDSWSVLRIGSHVALTVAHQIFHMNPDDARDIAAELTHAADAADPQEQE